MLPTDFILLFMLGLLIGSVSALLGVGGGFFYVPALVLFFGLDPRIAVGTSLAIITFTTLSASIGYGLRRRVLMKSTACLSIPGMVCAALGAFITVFLPSQYLVGFFCVILLFMGIKMVYRKFPLVFPLFVGPCWKERYGKFHAGPEELCIYPVHLVSWGGFAGFMSGLTGIGGGIVNVPALTIAGIPIHFAVATSTAVILITSLSATGTHLALGHVSIPFFIPFAVGAVVGAQAGVRLSHRTPPRILELAVGALLIVVVAALLINTYLS